MSCDPSMNKLTNYPLMSKTPGFLSHTWTCFIWTKLCLDFPIYASIFDYVSLSGTLNTKGSSYTYPHINRFEFGSWRWKHPNSIPTSWLEQPKAREVEKGAYDMRSPSLCVAVWTEELGSLNYAFLLQVWLH